jgi:protein SCO1
MKLRVASIALLIATYSLAHADAGRPAPLQEVGVDERIGERIPSELSFIDTTGRRVALGSLLDERSPVLLLLTYVRCESLCSLVLRGTIDALRALPRDGARVRLVLVSIDPTERIASAAARRAEIVSRIQHADIEVTYLVAAERTIRALADRIGFRYRVDARSDQIAHPAVLVVLTPDGRIARYLHGVQPAPDELAASLRVAASGNVFAPSLAEDILDCFRFDPTRRAHRDQIERYLRVGAGGVMLTVAVLIASLFLWERRRGRSA